MTICCCACFWMTRRPACGPRARKSSRPVSGTTGCVERWAATPSSGACPGAWAPPPLACHHRAARHRRAPLVARPGVADGPAAGRRCAPQFDVARSARGGRLPKRRDLPRSCRRQRAPTGDSRSTWHPRATGGWLTHSIGGAADRVPSPASARLRAQATPAAQKVGEEAHARRNTAPTHPSSSGRVTTSQVP
jgi:hypothetical protein